MKMYMAFFMVGLGCLILPHTQAQTTLSFTSRGDLASAIGYSNPPGLSSESTKAIGTRASFGLELAKTTGGNQAVLVGFEYAISGFDFRKELILASDFDTLTGTFNDSNSKLSGAYRYDFIALPLGYRWYNAGKTWRFYGQVSMIPMAYIRTISSFRITGDPRTTDSGRNPTFKDFHLATSTAIGLQRSFGSNWVIGLQPTFRIHLSSVTSTEFQERPWTAGLQLNIGRQLTGKQSSN